MSVCENEQLEAGAPGILVLCAEAPHDLTRNWLCCISPPEAQPEIQVMRDVMGPGQMHNQTVFYSWSVVHNSCSFFSVAVPVKALLHQWLGKKEVSRADAMAVKCCLIVSDCNWNSL